MAVAAVAASSSSVVVVAVVVVACVANQPTKESGPYGQVVSW